MIHILLKIFILIQRYRLVEISCGSVISVRMVAEMLKYYELKHLAHVIFGLENLLPSKALLGNLTDSDVIIRFIEVLESI